MVRGEKILPATGGSLRSSSICGHIRGLAQYRGTSIQGLEKSLKTAEHQFKVLRSHSLNVVKVVVDPEELAEWCIAKGRAVDADSRSQFAALKLVDEDRDVQTAH